MSLEARIEDGLRKRPSDERIYSEPLAAPGDMMGVEPVIAGPTRQSAVHRGAIPALAAMCAVLILGAAMLAIWSFGPWRGANVGGVTPSASGSGRSSPDASVRPTAAGSPAAELSPSSVTTPSPTVIHYVIQQGDYLSKIAARFNVQLWELKLANPQIANLDHIEVGWVINIPPPGLMTQPPIAQPSASGR